MILRWLFVISFIFTSSMFFSGLVAMIAMGKRPALQWSKLDMGAKSLYGLLLMVVLIFRFRTGRPLQGKFGQIMFTLWVLDGIIMSIANWGFVNYIFPGAPKRIIKSIKGFIGRLNKYV